MPQVKVIEEVSGLYKIAALKIFRKTEKVTSDFVPLKLIPRIDAIDRVIHEPHAISPGSVGDMERPWYMHPHQEDNLVVLSGERLVELYTRKLGRVEKFIISADGIKREDGSVIYSGGVMLSWPTLVFHRVKSTEKGSASINIAAHLEGFDIKTNFNIYGLDTGTGNFKLIREGYLDQFEV